MYGEQRGTLSFNSRNSDGSSPSFARLNMDLGWRWDNLSWQYFNSCFKCDSTYGNMMFSIFLVWDSLICLYTIGIYPIYGTFLDLGDYSVTTIEFPLNNLIIYLMLSVSFLFTSTISTISLCPLFVYIIELLIWQGEFGALDWVESIQTLFDGLTIGLSDLCDTASLITSSSASGLKTIGFPVIGYSFFHMEEKAKLN